MPPEGLPPQTQTTPLASCHGPIALGHLAPALSLSSLTTISPLMSLHEPLGRPYSPTNSHPTLDL